jgi:hypothetical protein
MVQSRERRDSEHADLPGAHGSLLQTTETLRSSDESGQIAQRSLKAEERVSLFWRLFGGTLLSIVALLCITAYQQFMNNLSDLRKDLNALTQSRADLVKQDDFNSRTTALWTSMKELQTAQSAMTALKERSTLLEQRIKSGEEERKEQVRELQALRERQAALEARLAIPAATNPAPRGGK